MYVPRSLRHARLGLPLAVVFALLVGTHAGLGQQAVPFEGGIPLAPRGLAGHPLPDAPLEFPTGEGERIRVVVVTRDLEYPWSLAFLPDGSMLVTERASRLRIIRNGVLDPRPVPGGPEAYFAGESGLPGAVHGYMDIALHPRFVDNQLLYLTYTKPLDERQRTVAVARARWTGSGLVDLQDLLVTEGASGAAKLAFGHDGTLFVATSGGDAQAPGSHGGKVLRINDDGTVPRDNPFARRAGYRPEVYSLGHRNSLGLAVHPVTGALWQAENGPQGGDELNVIRPGANYGWPFVSLGRTYQGPWQATARPTHEVFEPPVVYWTPSIAVSGLMFYTGTALSRWTGDVFVGGLRMGQIPGTGHLQRILFNEDMEELRREILLFELRQRIRDVRQGPDGFIYVVTDENPGAVIRIEPA